MQQKTAPTFSTIRTPSSYPASHKRYLPDIGIEVKRGLLTGRGDWIKVRDDTTLLIGPSSEYARRRDDLPTFNVRFPSSARPRRARDGKNVSQMHYAREGIVTPEMEFVALRESMRLEQWPVRSRNHGITFFMMELSQRTSR